MGLSAQALVDLQRAFQAVEETDGGQLDQVSFFCVFPLCTFCLFSCLLLAQLVLCDDLCMCSVVLFLLHLAIVALEDNNAEKKCGLCNQSPSFACNLGAASCGRKDSLLLVCKSNLLWMP